MFGGTLNLALSICLREEVGTKKGGQRRKEGKERREGEVCTRRSFQKSASVVKSSDSNVLMTLS